MEFWFLKMNNKLLILITVMILLVTLIVNAEIGCVDSTDCIDNFDRTDSLILGTSTSGNIWVEGGQGGGFNLDEHDINTNRMRYTAEGVGVGDASANLTFKSGHNMSITGSYIGHRFKVSTNNGEANVIYFMQSGVIVFNMLAEGPGGCATKDYRNSTITGLLFTTDLVCGNHDTSWMYYPNFENNSMDIEVNGTTSSSINIPFLVDGVTYIDGVGFGSSNTSGSLTVEHLTYYLNISFPTDITFSDNKRNITTPLQDYHVGFNITIASSNNISGYIFAYDNGTGDQFYNSSFQEFDGLETIVNATFNITIYNVSGVTWQWKWFANSTDGIWGESDTFSLVVSGTSAPVLTINPTNFFKADNTSFFNLGESKVALLNITFVDDIDMFGFEINITNSDNTQCFYASNISLNTVTDNVTLIMNVSGETGCDAEGFYFVNLTGWDSHTATTIQDYDIITGNNYLIFDGVIRISANNALTSKATKLKDKYNFEFTYRTWFTPKTKVFYIESDNILTYKTIGYKAHFIDWKEKKWIDFEGVDGQPIVTKINDYRYRIEYANEDEVVVFNSIGGLNQQSDYFKYYLVNPTVSWFFPTTTTSFFTNGTIVISLNVTSNYRNETRFRLYNSTKELIDSFNVSNNGTGSYFYTHSFDSGLSQNIYYINATHYDTVNSLTNSTTLTFSLAFFNVFFYDEIPATLILDEVELEVVGDTFAQNFTTTTGKIEVPGWVLEEYRLVYTSDNYPLREFYVTFTNITNQSVDLYMLSTGNSTDVAFTVQDNSGNELSSATVRLKRYYVATNSYITVAMGRTNEEGKTLINVDFNNAYYETLTTFGDFTLRTIGAKIITTTMILTINLIPDPLESIDIINNVDTSLTFNNVTETFSYVFTDLTGAARTGTLVVIEITPTSETILCTTTDTSVSATLLCQVNTTNITGSFIAKGSIRVDGVDVMTDRFDRAIGILKQTFKGLIGSQGIFITILIAGTLGGMGAVVSPATGIIMFLVGLGIMSFFGFNVIIIPLLVSFIILGSIIIYKMKSR